MTFQDLINQSHVSPDILWLSLSLPHRLPGPPDSSRQQWLFIPRGSAAVIPQWGAAVLLSLKLWDSQRDQPLHLIHGRCPRQCWKRIAITNRCVGYTSGEWRQLTKQRGCRFQQATHRWHPYFDFGGARQQTQDFWQPGQHTNWRQTHLCCQSFPRTVHGLWWAQFSSHGSELVLPTGKPRTHESSTSDGWQWWIIIPSDTRTNASWPTDHVPFCRFGLTETVCHRERTPSQPLLVLPSHRFLLCFHHNPHVLPIIGSTFFFTGVGFSAPVLDESQYGRPAVVRLPSQLQSVPALWAQDVPHPSPLWVRGIPCTQLQLHHIQFPLPFQQSNLQPVGGSSDPAGQTSQCRERRQ